MNNKKIMILVVTVMAILIVTIGASYAYFTANVTGNTTATATTINTGTMAITYTDGADVSATNWIPGDSLTKTFSVENTGNVATKYTIYLSELINKFGDPTDLVYTLTSSDGGKNVVETQLPTTSSAIVTDYDIGVGVKHTYSLKVTFKNKATAQDANQNKKFSFKMQINEVKEALVEPSTPELYQGLIPVKYDASGNTVVADTNTTWYDYTAHNWANAVFVDNTNSTIKDTYFNPDMTLKDSAIGMTIPEASILQYYVWIPRYKYLLWNAENGSSNEQSISITFEDKTATKSTGSTNGTWLTHPAFTFGTTELNGIWVGKFENSGTTSQVTIKPNVKSLTNINVSTMFNAVQSVENNSAYGLSAETVDTPMLKNMEWGAVAYLSSSIYGRYSDASTCISSGCETWINNNSEMITGCSGASVSASYDSTNTTACASGYDWTTLGVNASTTGNLYGIYDMSGGTWEFTMGNMVDSSGNFQPSNSGLTTVDSKYYDSYTYGTSYTDHARGKLGDATKETLQAFGSTSGGWYGDITYLPYGTGSRRSRTDCRSVHSRKIESF